MSQRGSIRKRGETWTAYWWVRTPEGTRRQRSKGGFRTKRAAQAHLTDILGAVQAGTWQEPGKLTVALYLVDHWLPSLDRRPSTMAQYRNVVETWIVPSLGGSTLAGLTPKAVQGFYDSLRGAQRKNGSGPLSDRTRQLVAVVLRKALQDALELGHVVRNPAAAVQRPKAARPEMTAWTAEETGVFLEHVRDHRLYAGWLLLLTRGFVEESCSACDGATLTSRRTARHPSDARGRGLLPHLLGSQDGHGPPYRADRS